MFSRAGALSCSQLCLQSLEQKWIPQLSAKVKGLSVCVCGQGQPAGELRVRPGPVGGDPDRNGARMTKETERQGQIRRKARNDLAPPYTVKRNEAQKSKAVTCIGSHSISLSQGFSSCAFLQAQPDHLMFPRCLCLYHSKTLLGEGQVLGLIPTLPQGGY